MSCGTTSSGASALSNSRSIVMLKTLILRAGAVIGEVQRLVDKRVEIDRATFAAAAARMFQHAPDDAVGALAVLSDLLQIACKQLHRIVDLSAGILVQRSDARPGDFLQFIQ